MAEGDSRSMILPRMFLRSCRKRLFSPKVADTSGMTLTGGSLLMRSLILRRLLDRSVLAPDEKYVGVLLPPSAGGVVVNASLALSRRVAINLNYTASSEMLGECIRQAGIRHVLTSRRVMEKLNLQIDAPVVYLEDFKEQVKLSDKLCAATMAYAFPAVALERWLGLHKVADDDLLTVIFTSGSTGQPKGVMLSQRNIASNVDAINYVIRLKHSDVMCGILPFFHSFGYTVTLWAVLALDIQAAYHFSPLDPRQVGKLCQEHKVTLLMSTPTFLRTYMRRCTKEEFATLDVIVAGAEKLPQDLRDSFEEKFGVRPVEGYGTTELSPLVSVNIPPSRARNGGSEGLREGSVGRPVRGVKARIVHPEMGEDLGIDRDGLLLIKGPNVMQGYMGQKELTERVIRDGWYSTGDIGRIDADGFIYITGRQSRFSKIGGEMVPHIKIEELLLQILASDDGAQNIAVTGVPDERKGERLIVLHTGMSLSPDVVCKRLAAAGLPNLWIPSPDSFCQVESIPLLGSGKLDLQALARLAEERCAQQAS